MSAKAWTRSTIRWPRGRRHPIVCKHPKTGRYVLYLGRRRNAYITGLSLVESEALLNELWSYADREELAWYNQWRVATWCCGDNRCTCTARPFDSNTRAYACTQ